MLKQWAVSAKFFVENGNISAHLLVNSIKLT